MPRKPAVPKAEREAARIHAALAWPAEPEPTPVNVRVVIGDAEFWRGWYVVPARDLAWAVGIGVTTGVSHSHNDLTAEQVRNRHRGQHTFSQGAGGPWYNTEREALLAYQWAQARHAAERLAAIQERMKGLKS